MTVFVDFIRYERHIPTNGSNRINKTIMKDLRAEPHCFLKRRKKRCPVLLNSAIEKQKNRIPKHKMVLKWYPKEVLF
jgi:hypothetical protein